MSCPNCKVFHNICKAECCAISPMEQEIYYRNFKKSVRPVIKMIPLAPGIIVPVTENGKCTFLNDDLSCNIYDDRPSVCIKFGDETHVLMSCAYQTKEGNERNPKDKKKILRIQKESTDRALGR